MFFWFFRACKKYRFTFVLSTYNGLKLILRPNNTFKNIELKGKYRDVPNINKVFLKAIKEMKKYRNGR